MAIGSSTRERVVAWAIVVLLVAAVLGVAYVGTPYTASAEEMAAVRANPNVTVSSMGEGYVLAPVDGTVDPSTDLRETALVYYPGARVDPTAYLPVLAPVVAQTGITVFVPRPPLNLAVLDPDMADPIIAGHPDVDRWFVGGHSLGGAMACRFAARNPDRISGVLLFGSYCDRDLGETGLRVLSVRGSADTVLDREASLRNRDNLPENDTVEVTIRGMNHTQFGVYSGQRGDSPATISYEQAHEALRDAMIDFLRDNPPRSDTPETDRAR